MAKNKNKNQAKQDSPEKAADKPQEAKQAPTPKEETPKGEKPAAGQESKDSSQTDNQGEPRTAEQELKPVIKDGSISCEPDENRMTEAESKAAQESEAREKFAAASNEQLEPGQLADPESGEPKKDGSGEGKEDGSKGAGGQTPRSSNRDAKGQPKKSSSPLAKFFGDDVDDDLEEDGTLKRGSEVFTAQKSGDKEPDNGPWCAMAENDGVTLYRKDA